MKDGREKEEGIERERKEWVRQRDRAREREKNEGLIRERRGNRDGERG